MRRAGVISLLTALIAAMLFITACGRNNSAGTPVSFNDNWLFIRQDSANADKILPGIIPNHKWEEVTLPHTAFIEPLPVTDQWTGICWYKKLYRPDRLQKHRHTGLLFDGAMQDAIVYINGAEISRHSGGYLPFYVNLTDDLEYGSENEILVRLDNRESPHNTSGKSVTGSGFPWYSGLYRNVSLYVTDRLHITAPPEYPSTIGGGIMTGVRDVSRESATVTLSVHVSNDDRIPRSFRMKNTMLDAAGLEIASSLSELTDLDPGQGQRLITRMIVMQPALWTPETPFLYTVRTELLSENGSKIAGRETRTGIRSVRITPDKGLLLNGQPLSLTGTNRHQEYPYIGYALSDNASYRDAIKIKEAGFNIVQCPHYPPAPAFLDACDELGLMVINSVPDWHDNGDSLFLDGPVQDVQMMCRRDRNHPSVVLWEIAPDGRPALVSLLTRLHQTVKEELPSGNNLTCGSTYSVVDVLIPSGNNSVAGVLIPSGADSASGANTTSGAESASGVLKTSGIDSVAGVLSASVPVTVATTTVEANQRTIPILRIKSGNSLMYDYNRGNGHGMNTGGIMNIFRLPKPVWWLYRSQSDEGPVCFIAHNNLPASGNSVTVYSNSDTVQLFRNDTLIAVQGPDSDSNGTKLNHPPFTFTMPGYSPGSLKAVALRSGKEVASHTVTTPGRPTAIRLTADFSNKQLEADNSDVIFIYATLTDSAGNQVFTADAMIEFTVRGNAELIGSNPVKAEAGIASILLRAIDPGKIMIQASSPGISEAELMTEAR